MTSHLLPSMFLIIVITAKIAGILYVNPVSQVSVVIQDHGELPAFQHQKSSSDSHFHKSTSLCQDRISLFILGGELHQVYFGGYYRIKALLCYCKKALLLTLERFHVWSLANW